MANIVLNLKQQQQQQQQTTQQNNTRQHTVRGRDALYTQFLWQKCRLHASVDPFKRVQN